VERLFVSRWDGFERKSSTDLPRAAESMARKLYEDSDARDIRMTVEVLPPFDQRPQALVIVEGTGNTGSLRNAMIFFHDEHGQAWSLSRFGTAAVPRDALVADLSEAAQSFRLVRSPKQQKPWWKVW
jgi:hypothetical protein